MSKLFHFALSVQPLPIWHPLGLGLGTRATSDKSSWQNQAEGPGDLDNFRMWKKKPYSIPLGGWLSHSETLLLLTVKADSWIHSCLCVYQTTLQNISLFLPFLKTWILMSLTCLNPVNKASVTCKHDLWKQTLSQLCLGSHHHIAISTDERLWLT